MLLVYEYNCKKIIYFTKEISYKIEIDLYISRLYILKKKIYINNKDIQIEKIIN